VHFVGLNVVKCLSTIHGMNNVKLKVFRLSVLTCTLIKAFLSLGVDGLKKR
jgi:hypothetical protein